MDNHCGIIKIALDLTKPNLTGYFCNGCSGQRPAVASALELTVIVET
jgi:hypothetical protein